MSIRAAHRALLTRLLPAAIGAGHGAELLERVLALGGRPEHGLLDRVAGIRGTFALQQALHAVRDGDEDELADGLAEYR
ncbi:hypothetical protein AB0G05_14240 [Nonomuraea wenchangensis]